MQEEELSMEVIFYVSEPLRWRKEESNLHMFPRLSFSLLIKSECTASITWRGKTETISED